MNKQSICRWFWTLWWTCGVTIMTHESLMLVVTVSSMLYDCCLGSIQVMCSQTGSRVWPGAQRRISLQWRHNERDDVSNHRRLDCLLNCLLRRRSKKTSKLRFIDLCEGRVATRQGKVMEKNIFSSSGNCQGILKNVREILKRGKCQGNVREFQQEWSVATLEGNPPMTGRFPSQKGQWRGKCFLLMTSSWSLPTKSSQEPRVRFQIRAADDSQLKNYCWSHVLESPSFLNVSDCTLLR